MNKMIVILIMIIVLFSTGYGRAQIQSNSSIAPPNAQNNKVTLDIKGMDVVDVLKMLATRSNMNIIVGKNVTGRVTLFLKAVDVHDAFDIIVLANDLAYEVKGGIVNVMTQRDYELIYGYRFRDSKQAKIIHLKYAKAADLSRSLAQIKTNIGKVVVDEGTNTIALIDTPEAIKSMLEFTAKTDKPIETRVFNLNYAQADKLGTKFQDSITKGVGSIKVDERTNKIAITDYPSRLDEIAKVLSSFDEKTQQVLIDAQLIEIKPSDKFQMGVDWEYWLRKYFDLRVALPINTLASGSNALFVGTNQPPPSPSPGKYNAVIDVLRTIGDTKILSSPRIMALNNQEARIHIGTKEAYITSTVSQNSVGPNVTSQTVNFVDTGIQLHVTPTINRDGFVTMKIKPEVSDAVITNLISQNQTTQVPIVTTSESETTVMVKDGVTIIIGGLRKDTRIKIVKKIPVLGDIPGLGHLFRSTEDSVTTDDLVILITPHIVSGEKSYSDFSELPPKDGVIAKMSSGKIIITKVSSNKLVNSEYSTLIANKIKALASFERTTAEKGEVKLGFTIGQEGKLVDGPFVLESNNALLNEPAMKTVKEAVAWTFDMSIHDYMPEEES